ncbi:MAG TPA: dihydroorotase [Candidatus Sulfomarinibacteraceae bacterium]|nr:dihydroorotase [Candidatus Sulfomarinibacteraceae bacterium]
MTPSNAVASPVGARVADLEITRAWLVDPASGREGPGEIVVTDGVLEAVTWLDGDEAEGVDASGVIVAPGFVDLHAHFREPGNEDAETVATGLAAAAHGGFTAVCVMPNTTPALDEPSVLVRIRDAAAASGSPVTLLAHGAVSAGRAGEQLAALGELADAGVVGFSDDGAPVRSAALLRNALAYAGMLGLPIVDHPEDPALTEGAEANEGLVATVLGLRGWPVAGEAGAVARDLAILADVVVDVPRARLHLTHLSTGAALALVRAAKAAGLPVTCDVTPHHLALTDEWVAGSRRWSWEVPGTGAAGGLPAGDAAGAAGDAWRDGAITAPPFDPSLRVNPPLRSAADAAACVAALIDGTADAIATDHAPHTEVDKAVEFGLAANGISGIETALGIVLAAVDAGRLPLATAIAALTTGPARVLGDRAPGLPGPRGLVEGGPADLVVFDRSATWKVEEDSLASKGKNSPLLGRDLPGRVLLTVAGGRIAYEADVE